MVAAFERIATPEFWAALGDADLEARVVAMEQTRRVIAVDEDYLDDIAAAFAKVVDAKSPFTSGHSDRVALFTDLIAEELGFDADRRRTLKRAALLHDIGKLGVSNQVLDKPGKLDDDEWAEIKQPPRAQRADPLPRRRLRAARPDRRRAPRAARRQGLPQGPRRPTISASKPASSPPPTSSTP